MDGSLKQTKLLFVSLARPSLNLGLEVGKRRMVWFDATPHVQFTWLAVFRKDTSLTESRPEREAPLQSTAASSASPSGPNRVCTNTCVYISIILCIITERKMRAWLACNNWVPHLTLSTVDQDRATSVRQSPITHTWASVCNFVVANFARLYSERTYSLVHIHVYMC